MLGSMRIGPFGRGGKAAGVVQTYSDIILAETGLLAYWRLSESSGPLVDAFAGYDLSITGSPTYSQAGALAAGANTAVLFSGTSKGTVNLALSFPFTIEGWVKMNANTDTELIWWSDGSGYGYGLRSAWAGGASKHYIMANSLDASGSAGGSVYTTGVSGQWYHVMGLFTSNSYRRLWVNGTAVAANTQTRAPSPTFMRLGSGGDCVLDEVAVYGADKSGVAADHYAAGIAA